MRSREATTNNTVAATIIGESSSWWSSSSSSSESTTDTTTSSAEDDDDSNYSKNNEESSLTFQPQNDHHSSNVRHRQDQQQHILQQQHPKQQPDVQLCSASTLASVRATLWSTQSSSTVYSDPSLRHVMSTQDSSTTTTTTTTTSMIPQAQDDLPYHHDESARTIPGRDCVTPLQDNRRITSLHHHHHSSLSPTPSDERDENNLNQNKTMTTTMTTPDVPLAVLISPTKRMDYTPPPAAVAAAADHVVPSIQADKDDPNLASIKGQPAAETETQEVAASNVHLQHHPGQRQRVMVRPSALERKLGEGGGRLGGGRRRMHYQPQPQQQQLLLRYPPDPMGDMAAVDRTSNVGGDGDDDDAAAFRDKDKYELRPFHTTSSRMGEEEEEQVEVIPWYDHRGEVPIVPWPDEESTICAASRDGTLEYSYQSSVESQQHTLQQQTHQQQTQPILSTRSSRHVISPDVSREDRLGYQQEHDGNDDDGDDDDTLRSMRERTRAALEASYESTSSKSQREEPLNEDALQIKMREQTMAALNHSFEALPQNKNTHTYRKANPDLNAMSPSLPRSSDQFHDPSSLEHQMDHGRSHLSSFKRQQMDSLIRQKENGNNEEKISTVQRIQQQYLAKSHPQNSIVTAQRQGRISISTNGTMPATPSQMTPISRPVSQEQSFSDHSTELSWRMDPSQSLSDWQLEIYNRATKDVTTYHVHRVVLAVGCRACGYFQRAINRPDAARIIDPSSSSAPVTRLALIARACELMPTILDYLYGGWSLVQLTTETVVGIAYLANCLEQSTLLHECMEFVHNDLTRDTMHIYLGDAIYYDQHELVDWILQLAAEELPTLDVSSPIVASFLTELSPHHVIHLFQKVTSFERESSWNLSSLLVEYSIYHRHEITLTFLDTCSSLMGVVTTDAALTLLELIFTLTNDKDNDENDRDKTYYCETSSQLRQRCLDVLADDWQAVYEREDGSTIWKRLMEHCSKAAASSNPKQQDQLLAWFPRALDRANQQLVQAQNELNESWERHAATREQLERAAREANQYRREAEHLRKTLDSTKSELTGQLKGWMKKRNNDLVEHKASQSHWHQEREIWKQERQAWLKERGELEHELYRLRAELSHIRKAEYKPKKNNGGNNSSSESSNERQRRRKTKKKENICPDVETKSIISYMSNVGMGEEMDDDEESWSDDRDTSFELNPL